ncbi:MAG: MerR family transcriptional regulator [Verrucomicrobiales bacterium]
MDQKRRMPTTEQFYEISAVARITGLSSHVLRVWERRYGVVEPRRSDSKRRQYTQENVDRLILLKRLVDNGHAIGSVADLSMDQLVERVARLEESIASNGANGANAAHSSKTVQRIGLIGSMIKQSVREVADGASDLRIVGEFDKLEELQDTFQAGAVDIIVLERDTLFFEDLNAIQAVTDKVEADRAFVIYRFAESRVLDSTSGTKITALRGPIEAAGIKLALGALSQPIPEPETDGKVFELEAVGDIPSRMFSGEDLVRISKISPSQQCECPRHLATILRSLTAFEEYSEKCENQNVEDAELHRFLHLTTAQCRYDMEKALAKVLTHEGIPY